MGNALAMLDWPSAGQLIVSAGCGLAVYGLSRSEVAQLVASEAAQTAAEAAAEAAAAEAAEVLTEASTSVATEALEAAASEAAAAAASAAAAAAEEAAGAAAETAGAGLGAAAAAAAGGGGTSAGTEALLTAAGVAAGLVMLDALCGRFLRRPKREVQRGVVVLTGCDSGLGFSLARHSLRMGVAVVAGCLDPSGEGARRLRAAAGRSGRLTVLPLDVTSSESVGAFARDVSRLLDDDPSLHLLALVNNAGVMVFGEFDWQTEEQVERQVEVNLLGTMRVTKAFCPLLRRDHARLIVVTSHCALESLPGLAPYGGTKAALEAWSNALRVEQSKYGVRVITLVPGSFSSRSNIMARHEQNARDMEQDMRLNRPEDWDFHKDYFQVFHSYLKVISGEKAVQELQDAQLYFKYECSLLALFPKQQYIHAPVRYNVYHTLMRAVPRWLRDEVVKVFMQLPAYNDEGLLMGLSGGRLLRREAITAAAAAGAAAEARLRDLRIINVDNEAKSKVSMGDEPGTSGIVTVGRVKSARDTSETASSSESNGARCIMHHTKYNRPRSGTGSAPGSPTRRASNHRVLSPTSPSLPVVGANSSTTKTSGVSLSTTTSHVQRTPLRLTLQQSSRSTKVSDQAESAASRSRWSRESVEKPKGRLYTDKSAESRGLTPTRVQSADRSRRHEPPIATPATVCPRHHSTATVPGAISQASTVYGMGSSSTSHQFQSQTQTSVLLPLSAPQSQSQHTPRLCPMHMQMHQQRQREKELELEREKERERAEEKEKEPTPSEVAAAAALARAEKNAKLMQENKSRQVETPPLPKENDMSGVAGKVSDNIVNIQPFIPTDPCYDYGRDSTAYPSCSGISAPRVISPEIRRVIPPSVVSAIPDGSTKGSVTQNSSYTSIVSTPSRPMHPVKMPAPITCYAVPRPQSQPPMGAMDSQASPYNSDAMDTIHSLQRKMMEKGVSDATTARKDTRPIKVMPEESSQGSASLEPPMTPASGLHPSDDEDNWISDEESDALFLQSAVRATPGEVQVAAAVAAFARQALLIEDLTSPNRKRQHSGQKSMTSSSSASSAEVLAEAAGMGASRAAPEGDRLGRLLHELLTRSGAAGTASHLRQLARELARELAASLRDAVRFDDPRCRAGADPRQEIRGVLREALLQDCGSGRGATRSAQRRLGLRLARRLLAAAGAGEAQYFPLTSPASEENAQMDGAQAGPAAGGRPATQPGPTLRVQQPGAPMLFEPSYGSESVTVSEVAAALAAASAHATVVAATSRAIAEEPEDEEKGGTIADEIAMEDMMPPPQTISSSLEKDASGPGEEAPGALLAAQFARELLERETQRMRKERQRRFVRDGKQEVESVKEPEGVACDVDGAAEEHWVCGRLRRALNDAGQPCDQSHVATLAEELAVAVESPDSKGAVWQALAETLRRRFLPVTQTTVVRLATEVSVRVRNAVSTMYHASLLGSPLPEPSLSSETIPHPPEQTDDLSDYGKDWDQNRDANWTTAAPSVTNKLPKFSKPEDLARSESEKPHYQRSQTPTPPPPPSPSPGLPKPNVIIPCNALTCSRLQGSLRSSSISKNEELPKSVEYPKLAEDRSLLSRKLSPKKSPERQDRKLSPKKSPERQAGKLSPKKSPERQDGKLSPKKSPERQDGKLSPKKSPERQDGKHSPKKSPELQDSRKSSLRVEPSAGTDNSRYSSGSDNMRRQSSPDSDAFSRHGGAPIPREDDVHYSGQSRSHTLSSRRGHSKSPIVRRKRSTSQSSDGKKKSRSNRDKDKVSLKSGGKDDDGKRRTSEYHKKDSRHERKSIKTEHKHRFEEAKVEEATTQEDLGKDTSSLVAVGDDSAELDKSSTSRMAKPRMGSKSPKGRFPIVVEARFTCTQVSEATGRHVASNVNQGTGLVAGSRGYVTQVSVTTRAESSEHIEMEEKGFDFLVNDDKSRERDVKKRRKKSSRSEKHGQSSDERSQKRESRWRARRKSKESGGKQEEDSPSIHILHKTDQPETESAVVFPGSETEIASKEPKPGKTISEGNTTPPLSTEVTDSGAEMTDDDGRQSSLGNLSDKEYHADQGPLISVSAPNPRKPHERRRPKSGERSRTPLVEKIYKAPLSGTEELSTAPSNPCAAILAGISPEPRSPVIMSTKVTLLNPHAKGNEQAKTREKSAEKKKAEVDSGIPEGVFQNAAVALPVATQLWGKNKTQEGLREGAPTENSTVAPFVADGSGRMPPPTQAREDQLKHRGNEKHTADVSRQANSSPTEQKKEDIETDARTDVSKTESPIQSLKLICKKGEVSKRNDEVVKKADEASKKYETNIKGSIKELRRTDSLPRKQYDANMKSESFYKRNVSQGSIGSGRSRNKSMEVLNKTEGEANRSEEILRKVMMGSKRSGEITERLNSLSKKSDDGKKEYESEKKVKDLPKTPSTAKTTPLASFKPQEALPVPKTHIGMGPCCNQKTCFMSTGICKPPAPPPSKSGAEQSSKEREPLCLTVGRARPTPISDPNPPSQSMKVEPAVSSSIPHDANVSSDGATTSTTQDDATKYLDGESDSSASHDRAKSSHTSDPLPTPIHQQSPDTVRADTIPTRYLDNNDPPVAPMVETVQTPLRYMDNPQYPREQVKPPSPLPIQMRYLEFEEGSSLSPKINRSTVMVNQGHGSQHRYLASTSTSQHVTNVPSQSSHVSTSKTLQHLKTSTNRPLTPPGTRASPTKPRTTGSTPRMAESFSRLRVPDCMVVMPVQSLTPERVPSMTMDRYAEAKKAFSSRPSTPIKGMISNEGLKEDDTERMTFTLQGSAPSASVCPMSPPKSDRTPAYSLSPEIQVESPIRRKTSLTVRGSPVQMRRSTSPEEGARPSSPPKGETSVQLNASRTSRTSRDKAIPARSKTPADKSFPSCPIHPHGQHPPTIQVDTPIPEVPKENPSVRVTVTYEGVTVPLMLSDINIDETETEERRIATDEKLRIDSSKMSPVADGLPSVLCVDDEPKIEPDIVGWDVHNLVGKEPLSEENPAQPPAETKYDSVTSNDTITEFKATPPLLQVPSIEQPLPALDTSPPCNLTVPIPSTTESKERDEGPAPVNSVSGGPVAPITSEEIVENWEMQMGEKPGTEAGVSSPGSACLTTPDVDPDIGVSSRQQMVSGSETLDDASKFWAASLDEPAGTKEDAQPEMGRACESSETKSDLCMSLSPASLPPTESLQVGGGAEEPPVSKEGGEALPDSGSGGGEA